MFGPIWSVVDEDAPEIFALMLLIYFLQNFLFFVSNNYFMIYLRTQVIDSFSYHFLVP